MFLKNYNYVVCYCVTPSLNPLILSIKNNTVRKKSAVLILCYVLPVHFERSSFRGLTYVFAVPKILFYFVFSFLVLIPFDFISHKVGKTYYLICVYLCCSDSHNTNNILLYIFCFTRGRIRTHSPRKTFLTKKLIILIVGGYFVFKYCNVVRKGIGERVKYFSSKIKKRSITGNRFSVC
jgi:hypothetical protein